MILFLRFCLLMLSLSGYIWYLAHRFQILAEFAPAVVCAFISTLLFLAGCCNLLPEMTVLLFVGGLVLPACLLYRKYKISACRTKQPVTARQKPCRRPFLVYAVFLCTALYFFLLLQKAHVTSYDNFSHWATVVKDMLRENRMPNFQDPIIRFQSYPLGSSLWIYYVCRIVGTAEGCMLWAQLLMMLCFLLCMAAFVHKENRYCILALLFFAVWAASANNSIYELRVDTLLPMAGIAAFAILFAYRQDPKKALYTCCGIFILLIQMKNSGIFFYAACLLFLAGSARKACQSKKLCFAGIGLAIPLFTMYLWKKHVAFAFADGMDSKHSMNMAHFGEMAAKKSREDIALIGQSILRRFTEFDNIEVKLLLLLTVVLLLFAVLLRKSGQTKKLLRLFAFCLFCAAAYTASLYAMYVFSMPMGESAHLASYDRYILSVLIFLYGITMIVVMDALRSTEAGTAGSRIAASVFLFFTVLLVFQVRQKLPLLSGIPDFTRTKRCQLQELFKEHGIQEGDSCAIYCNGTDDDKRYLFYLTRYELWTDAVLVVREEELLEHQSELADYEHLIVWDSDERIETFLDDAGREMDFKILLRQ
ncbi:MAG: hypothetical protein K2N87_20775 [Eubacterium sp.]|nr:hypothetical protein [Eubacterium sp.]